MIRPYHGGDIATARGLDTPIGEVSIYLEPQTQKILSWKKFLVLQNLPCDLVLGIEIIDEWRVYKNRRLLTLRLAPKSPGKFSIRAADSTIPT